MTKDVRRGLHHLRQFWSKQGDRRLHQYSYGDTDSLRLVLINAPIAEVDFGGRHFTGLTYQARALTVPSCVEG